MPKYTVKSPLDHNNKPYAPDSKVELSEEAAAPLLAVNAIEPLPEKKTDDDKNPKK